MNIAEVSHELLCAKAELNSVKERELIVSVFTRME